MNSKWTFGLCAWVMLYAAFGFYPKWNKSQAEATISWDVAGYYYYLPAFLMYHDAQKVAFHTEIDAKYQPQGGDFYSALPHPESGNMVMKYSMGMAILYAPAFLVAWAVAEPLGYPADGFSLPFQLALSVWSVLFALLGLWYLRKVLLRVGFSENITSATLLLYVLATNYLDYGSITAAMAHSYVFTLYSLLLWFTIDFYDTSKNGPSVFNALAIGKIVGLAILARPSELQIVIIPFLWGVSNVETLRARVAFIGQHWGKYALAVAFSAALISLQLVYWKWLTGHFFYKSYGKEDWFDWFKPHILDGLFSARKGWLVYTPIMVFSLFGGVFLWKKMRYAFWTVVLFAVAFVYISFAHNIWWYGGSLGQRQMVQAYPVLALPFAGFLTAASARRSWQIAVTAVSVVCIYLNLWWTYQAHVGGNFDADGMTRAYFWRILGRWDIHPDSRKLLDNKYDFTGTMRDVKTIFQNDFENDTNAVVQTQLVLNGQKSAVLGGEKPFLPRQNVPLSNHEYKWLRVSMKVKTTQKEWNLWQMAQMILEFKKGEETVRANMLRVHRIMGDNESKTIWLDAKVPKQDFDNVVFFVWNPSNKVIVVDDVSVVAFNE